MSFSSLLTTLAALQIYTSSGVATYSTGFFRFSTNPNNAHNNPSTCGLGLESTTPLSTSCGPRFCNLPGIASLNLARKVTICCSHPKLSADVYTAFQARHKRAFSRHRLTATAGSSASTSSCGGEGSRLGRGGDTTGGGKADFVAALDLAKMGKSFWISVSSCSDRSLLSESAMMSV